MGSDLSNNSHPINADETEESKHGSEEEDKNKSGELNDILSQNVAQTTSSLESNNVTGKSIYQPTQNITPAVKSNAHLASSNSDAENNLSTHISMSVSGQARVNSNVSR